MAGRAFEASRGRALSGLGIPALTWDMTKAGLSPAGSRAVPSQMTTHLLLVCEGLLMANQTRMAPTSALRQVRVDDVEFHLEEVGSGKPLLMLHGGPGIGHSYLRPGMDALADAYRAIYYDQRGSGRTPLGDEGKVTLAGGIADLEGLRRKLGIKRLNLVGHSFGAILGLLYASRHPEAVASLVVANPGPPFVPELMAQFGAAMGKRYSAEEAKEKMELEASAAYAKRDPKAVEQAFRLTYLPFFKSRKDADAVDFGFTQTTARNAPLAAGRTFRDLAELRPVEGLARIACPTLVVHAELDPLPEAFSRLVADKIPKSEFKFIGGANHFAYLDDPGAFFGVARAFLQENAE